MRAIRAFVAALLALTLLACGPKEGEEESVLAVFELVRAGEFETFEARLSEQSRTPETRATLEQLRRDMIPSGEPESVRLLKWSLLAATGERTVTAIHEYTYPDRLLIVTTTLKTIGTSPYTIEGFHITFLDADEVPATEFSLQGKSIQQLAFLGALIASVTVMAMALLGTIFTKSFKRKWFWAIVSLVGAPVFLMNWATGAWEPHFAVGLINAGVMKGLSPLDPWIVRFHIPIGAFVTLLLLLPHWTHRAPDGRQK